MEKMKRLFLASIALLLLGEGMSFGVWVPSTSLDNAPVGPVEKMSADEAVVQRLPAVVARLEQDERRLANLMNNFERDEEALKKRAKLSSHKNERVSGQAQRSK